MRRDSLLLLGLLTTICLIAGLVVGIQSNHFVAGVAAASPTAPRATVSGTAPPGLPGTAASTLQPLASAPQMAVLFVGVTDAGALQPKFEGCWIVAFSPGINRYYVLSVPPEAHFRLASLGSAQTLADIYGQDVQQEAGYRFMRDAIQSVFPAMTIQAEVTLDRGDVTDLVSKVGGISVGGAVMLGGALAAAYDRQSFIGSTARMEFQHQAFQAIFQALADQHWTPASVAYYLEQIPHAVRPDGAAALTQLANGAPSLSSELTWTVVGGTRDTATIP